MPSLVEFHTILGRTFFIFALVMGVWGMLMYFRGAAPDSSYWGALVVGEAVAILQALLGIVRLVGGGQPTRGIHILYGTLTVIMWPAIFGYARGQRGTRGESLLYGAGSLFLFGLGLRAFSTG